MSEAVGRDGHHFLPQKNITNGGPDGGGNGRGEMSFSGG